MHVVGQKWSDGGGRGDLARAGRVQSNVWRFRNGHGQPPHGRLSLDSKARLWRVGEGRGHAGYHYRP